MRLIRRVFDPAVAYVLRKPMTYQGKVYRAGEFFPWKDLGCIQDKAQRIFKAGYLVESPEKVEESDEDRPSEGSEDSDTGTATEGSGAVTMESGNNDESPEEFNLITATVAQLQKKAKELNIDAKGNKNELRNRVFEAMGR